MSKHKWHKEIKAWADGKQIQCRRYCIDEEWNDTNPIWDDLYEYRIKPQPKEPQYLYVYFDPNYGIETKFIANKNAEPPRGMEYLGKIKLEVNDE